MSLYTDGNLAVEFEEEKLPNRKNNRKTKNQSISGKEKLFYLFSLIFVIIIASVVISGYASITKLNYEVQEVQKSINTINQENENIEMQIVELSTPDRIIKYAQEELGMTLDEDQIIVLTNNE